MTRELTPRTPSFEDFLRLRDLLPRNWPWQPEYAPTLLGYGEFLADRDTWLDLLKGWKTFGTPIVYGDHPHGGGVA